MMKSRHLENAIGGVEYQKVEHIMDLQPVVYSNQRILTTQQIAQAYGTDAKHINDNFQSNKARYVESKHYYAPRGEDLKSFLNLYPEIFGVQNPSKIRSLYLWTQKGALLHAKSLGTDQAWDIYEHLVDDYFEYKEQIEQQNHSQCLPLQGETLADIVISMLPVPGYADLQRIKSFVNAAEARYYPKKAQLSDPKQDSINQQYARILRVMDHVKKPLTAAQLHSCYIKSLDTSTIRLRCDELTQRGLLLKYHTAHAPQGRYQSII